MKQAAMYIVTPAKLLALFTRPIDRKYFAKPVRVIVDRKDDEGLVWVTDPVRSQSYPVERRHLVGEWKLTKRQAELSKVAS